MIQLNYFDWETAPGRSNVNAKYLYDDFVKRKIPTIVMAPLWGGRLAAGHYKAQARLKRKDAEASIASWAFRFAGSLPNVLTILSGVTFLEHLQDNIDGATDDIRKGVLPPGMHRLHGGVSH